MNSAELLKKNADLEAANAELTKTASSQSKLIKTLTQEVSEHTKLAAEAGETLEAVAKKAGDAVEEGINNADNPGALSEEAQDALVEAVSKVDPDIGAEVAQELTDLDVTDEDMTTEKVASITTRAFTKLSVKSGRSFSEGRVRKPAERTKTASAGKGTFSKGLSGELDRLRNN